MTKIGEQKYAAALLTLETMQKQLKKTGWAPAGSPGRIAGRISGRISGPAGYPVRGGDMGKIHEN